MKRRDLLKSFIFAPILGLFKGKKADPKYEFSGDHSGPSSSISGYPCPSVEEILTHVHTRPKYEFGTCFVTKSGHRFRYVKRKTSLVWYWVPENEFLTGKYS